MTAKTDFAFQRIADLADGTRTDMHPRIALAHIRRIAETALDEHIPSLAGVRVRLDPKLPPDSAEIRTPDGEILWRIG